MNARNVSAVPALFKSFPSINARAVGFDHLFDMMNRLSDFEVPNYPPYNVLKFGEDRYQVVIAATGFSRDDIQIETTKEDLVVKSSSREESGSDSAVFIHRGLAMRDFVLKFKIADNVEVEKATFENGLLTIDLKTIVAEEDKPKMIPIL